ncbi:MAG: hypothetical protein IKH88_06035 [Prevotella sp.]|nr:hypothetical protein [Prevotella sp.]
MNTKEQLQLNKTQTLLEIAIKGGKNGRRAMLQLRCQYRPLFIEAVQKSIKGEVPFLLASKYHDAFDSILRDYIYQHEVMDMSEFESFLNSQLHRMVNRELKIRRFNRKVRKGYKMDPMRAMQLMTRLYMDSCGISLTERTLAYDAGWIWFEEYLKNHPEEKRWNADTPFMEVMALISEEFTEEEYGKYDIGSIRLEDKILFAAEMIEDVDEETAVALCWAINTEMTREEKLRLSKSRAVLASALPSESRFDQRSKPCLWQLIKVLRTFSTLFDISEKAIFYSRKDAEEEMMRWTTHQTDELLCFIIRKLPLEKAYCDDLCFYDRDFDKPWLETGGVEEHVYTPGGFEKKPCFQKGDLVEYILHDENITLLSKGVVDKTPTEDEDCYVILDNETSIDISGPAWFDCAVRVPSRYVFPLKHFKLKDK